MAESHDEADSADLEESHRVVTAVGQFLGAADVVLATQAVPVEEDPFEVALLHINDMLAGLAGFEDYEFYCLLDGAIEVVATWTSFEAFAATWDAERSFRAAPCGPDEGEELTLLGRHEDSGELVIEVVRVADIDDRTSIYYHVARNKAHNDLYGNYRFLFAMRGRCLPSVTLESLANHIAGQSEHREAIAG